MKRGEIRFTGSIKRGDLRFTTGSMKRGKLRFTDSMKREEKLGLQNL